MNPKTLTLIAGLAALVAGPALAGATVAEGTHVKLKAHWASLHKQGGYGMPWTAVPRAVVATFTGGQSRQVTQQKSAGSSGF